MPISLISYHPVDATSQVLHILSLANDTLLGRSDNLSRTPHVGSGHGSTSLAHRLYQHHRESLAPTTQHINGRLTVKTQHILAITQENRIHLCHVIRQKRLQEVQRFLRALPSQHQLPLRMPMSDQVPSLHQDIKSLTMPDVHTSCRQQHLLLSLHLRTRTKSQRIRHHRQSLGKLLENIIVYLSQHGRMAIQNR